MSELDARRSDWLINLWDAIGKLTHRIDELESRTQQIEEEQKQKKGWRYRGKHGKI